MPTTSDYVTDLGYPLYLRSVIKIERPPGETIEFPSINDLLPVSLTQFFKETKDSCPEYSGLRKRLISFRFQDVVYQVSFPFPFSDSRFSQVKTDLENLGVSAFERIGERMPNHFLRLILTKI